MDGAVPEPADAPGGEPPLVDVASLAGRLAACPDLALFLDFDGTLAEIVPEPEAAVPLPGVLAACRALAAGGVPVAFLTGRDRRDLEGRAPVPGAHYAGSHGFDIAGPVLTREMGAPFTARIAAAAAALVVGPGRIAGARVEAKRYAVALHERGVADGDLPALRSGFATVAAAFPDLRRKSGKRVWELQPDLDWHKGRAIEALCDAMGRVWPVFLGDDVTDEDGFRSVAARGGLGVLVADSPRASAAGARLAHPTDAARLLTALAAVRGNPQAGSGLPRHSGAPRNGDEQA